MSRVVTATEAKNRLGALLEAVAEHQDEVIVESHGRARAVILPVDAYEEFQALRDQKRRTDAIARLDQLNKRIEMANRDSGWTDDEAIAIADAISHEIINRVAERGELTFERDRRADSGRSTAAR
ncbi:MAG TPA: type II toxin-antitoxin system Phd/YefM family antitoxin [Thermomicrobiales bacterium]|nr:type II toxin-antitoxin system Phd/YefM family antitoxin [Thermomicrobiales bacterium]